MLDAAWQNSNVGSADLFKNDYDYHWAPGTPQYEWLANDLATHPRALRFAFFHFPMYSDQSSTSSDTHLQGPGSLEGLLKELEVNTLVVCGSNFPNCPRTTIYEASERDFRVMLVDDAMSGVYDQGRRELVNISVRIATTAECLGWLAGQVIA